MLYLSKYTNEQVYSLSGLSELEVQGQSQLVTEIVILVTSPVGRALESMFNR